MLLENVTLERFDKILGGLHFVAPFHEATQPGYLLLVFGIALTASLLLVAPVGRDAVLGHLVHLVRTYLYFERLVVQRPHSSVQRLVHRLFRSSNIIVEFARDRGP